MFTEIFRTVLAALRSAFRSRAALIAENAVLRQQIIVLRRSVPKPRIRARDRVVLATAKSVFRLGPTESFQHTDPTSLDRLVDGVWG